MKVAEFAGILSSNALYRAVGAWPGVAVFIAAGALLAPGVDSLSVAAAYSDPVARVHAQDESLYAAGALDWMDSKDRLTPKALGRFLLYKPPFLVWCAGLSLKAFGVSLWALRLPAFTAGVLGAVLLFRMTGGSGWIALSLILSSAMWHTFAKLCYTDMLLVCLIVAALSIVDRDLALSRRKSLFGFAAACAAGIMTKNVAGLVPLIVVVAMTLAGSAGFVAKASCPSWKRVLQLSLLIGALAAPWHVYQLLTHREWFVADYFQLQLLAFGLEPPAQYAAEPAWLFYLSRIVRLEPTLLAFAMLGAWAFAAGVRRREPRAVLTACWLGTSAAALLAFQYRNVPYLLQIVPPLALIAARYGPWSTARRRVVAVVVVIAAFAVHLTMGRHPLAVQLTTDAPPDPWRTMKEYSLSHRGRELIAVSPDDAFYSSTLGLPKVRYVFLDPQGIVAKYAPHYVHLGITLTVDEALALPSLTEEFRKRLLGWGLDSTEPIGTTITARTQDELVRLLRANPDCDLYVPEDLWREARMDGTHELIIAFPGRVLALSKSEPSTRFPTSKVRPAKW